MKRPIPVCNPPLSIPRSLSRVRALPQSCTDLCGNGVVAAPSLGKGDGPISADTKIGTVPVSLTQTSPGARAFLLAQAFTPGKRDAVIDVPFSVRSPSGDQPRAASDDLRPLKGADEKKTENHGPSFPGVNAWASEKARRSDRDSVRQRATVRAPAIVEAASRRFVLTSSPEAARITRRDAASTACERRCNSEVISVRRSAAFTLVEIMVALALSLLLLAAVISMFGKVSEGIGDSRSLLEMADRLRLAEERLQLDLAGVTVTMNPPAIPPITRATSSISKAARRSVVSPRIRT